MTQGGLLWYTTGLQCNSTKMLFSQLSIIWKQCYIFRKRAYLEEKFLGDTLKWQLQFKKGHFFLEIRRDRTTKGPKIGSAIYETLNQIRIDTKNALRKLGWLFTLHFLVFFNISLSNHEEVLFCLILYFQHHPPVP